MLTFEGMPVLDTSLRDFVLKMNQSTESQTKDIEEFLHLLSLSL